MGRIKPRTEVGEPVVDWLRKIPKTETHLHIEGALPYILLRELDPDRFPANPYFREHGYFGGADKIYEALDLLGAERIQHGTRAFEDPDLLQRLADEGVILDICPISSEKLRVVEQLEDHPIRGYFDAGVTCTINTDDPLCFANTLSGEYEALHDRLGFKRSELAKIAKNGFRFARMDEELKNSYIAEIDSLLSEEIE